MDNLKPSPFADACQTLFGRNARRLSEFAAEMRAMTREQRQQAAEMLGVRLVSTKVTLTR